jgi:beta-1,4-mannosyltransferase
MSDSNQPKMQVLMMPDYRPDNPYQRLLSEALAAWGVEVRFPVGYRRCLPLWRAWRDAPGTKVLHLHWISPYLRGRNALTQAAYGLRLLADLSLLRLSGVGLVWTIHNRISHESRWPALERWVQRALARGIDRFIIHARANFDELRRDFSLRPERISVIPHGHYRGAYGPPVDSGTARYALGLPTASRIYLCFGMLRPYKGTEKLISEWLSTSHRAEDLLVIAGKALDDHFQQQLLSMAAGSDSIRILPSFVPASQVHLFFSAADLVVLPFNTILTSGSLLLAMSYGKPIIAPRFGAIAEMVGNADDLLYDPEDTHGLRSSLERSTTVALGPLSAKTEEMCRSLDWLRLAQMTADTYEQALQGRKRRNLRHDWWERVG